MRLRVRVSPGASRDHVGGRYGSADPPVLVVRVRQPAHDGKANEALRTALAAAFGVPSQSVRIVNGAGGRDKLVEVDGADPDLLVALLGA